MKISIAIILIIISTVSSAIAGEHANRLSQCLFSNTTAADKQILTKWVFTTLANHPTLSDMATIEQNIRSGADREMAQLIEKFIYDKCNEQLRAAVKNEGPMAIQTSIRSYVEQTGREILQHPSIAGSIGGVASQMSAQKLFEALMAQ